MYDFIQKDSDFITEVREENDELPTDKMRTDKMLNNQTEEENATAILSEEELSEEKLSKGEIPSKEEILNAELNGFGKGFKSGRVGSNAGRKVMKDTPLAELTFRKYEMPYDADTRDLLRKFCLSIGLLQPGDSRDIIVDVFHVLLQAKKEQKHLNSDDIRSLVIEERKNQNLPMLGVAASNIRRQIKRLRDVFLVEKIKNEYKITEFNGLEDTFNEKIESYLLPSIIGRLKEYIKSIDKKFA